ncbi:BglII/BstYI family type II restriction endonuclease [Vitreimonas flagellata]|uniref:BglII/BstYI family type II restriction endonuclease n=1 Tax=Vitreimonas flagellata TaxID=2560861 RepID=UPI001EF89280|nr:BglII/BstYI family type II restriction endonuclease [Vitreimonas flagellata]
MADLYEVHEWRNAAGVMSTACPQEWRELLDCLRSFRLLRSEILIPGGNRSFISDRFEKPFNERGWTEREFRTGIQVDGEVTPSPTHSVDCFKGRVALELEWNNKDPFYDRDLNNFRLLFELRVIDLGVIVTRSDHLQDIFKQLGRGASYGASTTHMSKLLPKIQGGGGGGCPILVFGITRNLYVEDETPEPISVSFEPGEDAGE